MKYQSLRGMNDILPTESLIWQRVEKACVEVFRLHNYQQIRTPLLEMTELFTRAVGDGTDIVKKEIYSFTDKGKREVALRPEGTASIVRAGLENNLILKDKLVKLYYFGPMFRYERPQSGRYRQFHQAGIEAFGSDNPELDAETIQVALEIFKRLELENLEVDINSVGCKNCRPAYLELLKKYFAGKDLCAECKIRREFNTLRILDCKETHCHPIIKLAPASIESLCEECKVHFEKVLKCLDAFQIKYRINKRLVRGLDYYTKTTYEIVSKTLGAQNAVCGGGRYNNLVEDFGGPSIPAVGFAIGLERLIEILKSKIQNSKSKQGTLLYVAPIGGNSRGVALEYLQKAREAGIAADIDYQNKKLKSQLKDADQLGADFVLIIGEDEIKKNVVVLRNMKEASQVEIPFDEALEKIKA